MEEQVERIFSEIMHRFLAFVVVEQSRIHLGIASSTRKISILQQDNNCSITPFLQSEQHTTRQERVVLFSLPETE
jgi:hypothetical protein